MNGGQLLIKILLLAAFALLGLVLIFPGKGTRHLALRRLSLGLMIVAGFLAIIFPDWLTALAHLVGVGRGADLLLYGLAVLFVGQLVRNRSKENATLRQVTDLARHVALIEAPPAAAAGRAALAAASRGGQRPAAPTEAGAPDGATAAGDGA